jgi:hypothetical protein
MKVTLELSAEVHQRLFAEAARRRLSINELITEFAFSLPHVEAPTRLNFIGIGDSGRSDLGRRHREIRQEQTKGLTARDL